MDANQYSRTELYYLRPIRWARGLHVVARRARYAALHAREHEFRRFPIENSVERS